MDAETEASRNPKEFQKVFFDPNGYLDELIEREKFILYGRKGDGKTAYEAQIQLTAEERNVYVRPCSMNKFNDLVFSRIKSYQDLGGNTYIHFWKCVLMIECVRTLYRYNPNIQADSFVSIVEALSRHDFLKIENDISSTVIRLVESDTTLSVKGIFQQRAKFAKESELRGAEQIFQVIRDSIQTIYLNNKKFLLIVDGLDDVLNSDECNPNIIMGLLRAVDEINTYFQYHGELSLKILVLIREDILKLCRDPNRSKIVRDSGLKLSWTISGSPYESDLIRLVSRRVAQIVSVETGEDAFATMWKDIFPDTIGMKDSLDYVLENIIYRPRDILQFFTEAQKRFVPGRLLSLEDIQTVLRQYSEDYFIDAMQDELTGFFPDTVVSVLPNILSQLESREFLLSDFQKECDDYPEFSGVSPLAVLDKLFNAGYIGQLRQRDKKDYTVFSYRNPHETFRASDPCLVHRGLIRALPGLQ